MTPDLETTVPTQIQHLSIPEASGLAGLALAGSAVLLILLWHAGRAASAGARRQLAGRDGADVLTYLAAGIATGVAAQGMWRFFRDVLHFEPILRVGFFGFLEVAVLASAVRARRNIQTTEAAGVDGAAVWVLTAMSGVLSALHAASFPEAVFRLSAPLVAAWLWHRSMGAERRARSGRTGIHWALTPERVLVWAGLAEATGRTTQQVEVERRLTRLARAAHRARMSTGRRRARALARLGVEMDRTVTHTSVATDPAQSHYLLAQLGALTGAAALLDVDTPAPWSVHRSDPAPTAESEAPSPATTVEAPRAAPSPVVGGSVGAAAVLAAVPIAAPVQFHAKRPGWPWSAAPLPGLRAASAARRVCGPHRPAPQRPAQARPGGRAPHEPAAPPADRRPDTQMSDDQIAVDIRDHHPDLSLRATTKRYGIHFYRAQRIHNDVLPNLRKPPPVTNPESDSSHPQDSQSLDHLEHTPMQRS